MLKRGFVVLLCEVADPAALGEVAFGVQHCREHGGLACPGRPHEHDDPAGRQLSAGVAHLVPEVGALHFGDETLVEQLHALGEVRVVEVAVDLDFDGVALGEPQPEGLDLVGVVDDAVLVEVHDAFGACRPVAGVAVEVTHRHELWPVEGHGPCACAGALGDRPEQLHRSVQVGVRGDPADDGDHERPEGLLGDPSPRVGGRVPASPVVEAPFVVEHADGVGGHDVEPEGGREVLGLLAGVRRPAVGEDRPAVLVVDLDGAASPPFEPCGLLGFVVVGDVGHCFEWLGHAAVLSAMSMASGKLTPSRSMIQVNTSPPCPQP